MPSVKDVTILFLAEGEQAVREAFARGEITRAVLRKAAGTVTGVDVSDLTAARQRGRKPPSAGEERHYKVIGEGASFVRVPMAALGLVAGDQVRIAFGSDSITVERA